MKIEYKVIEAYESSNEDPIELVVGDRVSITEQSNEDGPWPNWVYCLLERTKKEGWVPIQVLDIENKIGVAKNDYTAKELTIKEDEILLGEYTLNGWLWCKRKKNEEYGWVPQQNIK